MARCSPRMGQSIVHMPVQYHVSYLMKYRHCTKAVATCAAPKSRCWTLPIASHVISCAPDGKLSNRVFFWQILEAEIIEQTCHTRPRGPCTTHTLPLGTLHCVLPCRSAHGRLLTMVFRRYGGRCRTVPRRRRSSEPFIRAVPTSRFSEPFLS